MWTIIRVRYPSLAFVRIIRGCVLHSFCRAQPSCVSLGAEPIPVWSERGGMPRCLLIETSSQTCTVVAMCSISVLRGCLLCICSFHVSLNILFGYWARLWQPAALGCSTTCFFSGHAGLSWSWLWASAGGLSEWHLSGFLKLRRSWRNTASLLPWNWASVSFKCVPGNEHAQRTGKSLSSDREEMIVVLHL